MHERQHEANGHSGPGNSVVPAGNFALGPARGDPYYPRGLHTPEAAEDSLAVTLRQYLHVALKRKWIILSVTLVFVTLGGVRTFLMTPLYSATARVQIDREAVKLVEGGSVSPSEEGGSDFMRTQFELLQSRAMAERVVSSLRINEDEDFFKSQDASPLRFLRELFSSQAKYEKLPPSVLQEQAVEKVLRNLTVSPVKGSRLVDLTYRDPSSGRAQRVANAYADAYMASVLDKRFQANAYAKSFLDDQIKQLKIRLEDSEKALVDFSEREKVVQTGEKTSIAENNLAAANAALGQLISERIKNEQIWRQVENASAINLPQLLANNVIDVLRGQRKAFETEYQEKLENFKPSYPAMVQISNKIKEIDRQLAAEVKTIRNSLKAAYESSLAQENEMKARIESLRNEVLDLQKKGIQYSILRREAETNRGLYNSLLQRYKEIDVASGAATNNVFIVDRARNPGAPTEPMIYRAIMIYLAIGIAFGGGCAVLLEALDDRIRAPEEVEQVLGLSTLGIIPSVESAEKAGEALSDPHSALSEAYRSLATALQFSTENGLPRSIAITSAGMGEGKSTTALVIARHFAQLGLKVLLVDADLRKPSLHLKQRMDNSAGLSNFLTGASKPPEVIQKTDNPNLAFMASGPLLANAADLLSGKRIFSLVSIGTEVFDLIIFDAPPLLGLADAQIIASAAAATILVVGAGDQRKGIIRSALHRLQLARVSVLGAVLTKFHPKTAGYAYAYSYSYGYAYSDMGAADSYAKALEAGSQNQDQQQLSLHLN